MDKINSLEPVMERLSDEDLRGKTAEFRKRLADGASLDSILVEAFAVVRETSKRVLKMRHFDVQLVRLCFKQFVPLCEDAERVI